MTRALLIGVGTLLLPTLALAQNAPSAPSASPSPTVEAGLDVNGPPPGLHLVDDTEPKPPAIAPAADLLGSHLLVGAAFGPSWSLGRLAANVPTTHGLGTGLGFRADAGFGLSRSLALGAWASLATYADGTVCGDSCSGKAFAIGPFARYHLSQGLRFDPWLSVGGGYRRLSYTDANGARQTFAGIQWLDLELGADYYLFSGFGFGPYGALALTSYTQRPNLAGSASVNAELSAGLRLLFDLPGR